MTARWYSAWILFFDISIVFVMYGLWVTLTLTGRLGLSAELTHKHSMTGLNLSAGNGVLSYEADYPLPGNAAVGGSNATSAASAAGNVNSSAKYKYAGNVVQRSSGGVTSSPPAVGPGFSLGGIELSSLLLETNKP